MLSFKSKNIKLHLMKNKNKSEIKANRKIKNLNNFTIVKKPLRQQVFVTKVFIKILYKIFFISKNYSKHDRDIIVLKRFLTFVCLIVIIL